MAVTSPARRRLVTVLTIAVLFCTGLAWQPAAAESGTPDRDPEGRVFDLNDALVPPDAPGLADIVAQASGDYRIDALLSGYQLPSANMTYSFYSDSVFAGSYYGSESGVHEVSAAVKASVRQIMAWYGTLMNVTFTEVTETSSQIGYIRFMDSSAPSYAYAYYPSGTAMFSLSGDIHLNTNYDRLGDTNGFQHPAGYHGYQALVHEIGHTLGLKHPFEGSPTLPAGEDNDSYTMMTYTWPSPYEAATPMPYDVMALHYLYGARPKWTGNDTYAFTRGVDQYTLGGATYQNSPYSYKQTIWDSDGFNVLDLSAIPASASGYRIDMKGIGWLCKGADYRTTYMMAGTAIGSGVVIRDVVNSIGADTIYANPAANTFKGYDRTRATGQDVLYDAAPADTLDLSGYSPGEVTQTQNGNDLVVTLGTNGSITIKDYYLGKAPAIVFTAVTPTASINDVTVTEGNSGTSNANFIVSLSVPAGSTVTVEYRTADGTARADEDYTATAGTLTFQVGESQKTVPVPVIGDTAVEPDETFSVNLSNPTGGLTITDGQGVGTLLNDDQPPNQSPVAVIGANPTSGYAPLAVSFNGSASYDPDGSIVSYAWNFGDGSSGTGATATHTYAAAGSYTAVLTVTDNRGGTGTAATTVTASQDPAKVVRVADITMSVVTSVRNRAAKAVIKVTNLSNLPVANATVNVRWSGLVTGSASGKTDANGQVTFTSKSTSKRGTVTITVTGLTPPAGSVYDSTQNLKSSAAIVF